MEHRERKSEPDSDLKEWRHIYETLEWYGQEGMSSDDSDVEDIEEIYRPKVLPWRHKLADSYMDLLDRTRKAPGQQSHSRKGRPPTKRIRDGEETQKSDRKPVEGLPVHLYRRSWLDSLTPTDRKALMPSLSQFQLRKIIKTKAADADKIEEDEVEEAMDSSD